MSEALSWLADGRIGTVRLRWTELLHRMTLWWLGRACGSWPPSSARAARSVLLVEASSLPREKSCGGMLNLYSRRALEPYGAVPEEMILDPKWIDFRYYHIDREVKKPTQVRFLNVDRGMFDEWLLSFLPANVHVACGALMTLAKPVKAAGAPEGPPCRRRIAWKRVWTARISSQRMDRVPR